MSNNSEKDTIVLKVIVEVPMDKWIAYSRQALKEDIKPKKKLRKVLTGEINGLV